MFKFRVNSNLVIGGETINGRRERPTINRPKIRTMNWDRATQMTQNRQTNTRMEYVLKNKQEV